jgi:DMSO reductase family type II enzyme chaperone
MNQVAEKKAVEQNGAVFSEVFQTDTLKTDGEKQTAGRSNMYALLADVFRYPDEAFRNFVRNGELVDGLVDFVSALPFEYSITDREKKSLTFPDSLSDDDIEAEFIRLFEAGPGDPPCPLIEGKYNKDANRRAIFEDLIRFYNNFGLSYKEGPQDDRPDHISYELEFMHYLAFLTLRAMQNNKETNHYLLAQKDFLEHHTVKWASKLAGRMQDIVKEIPEPDAAVLFYIDLINILDRYITADFDYLKNILAD